MSDLPKILFIGDYCRQDYISLLSDTKEHATIYFLFYASSKEESNKGYKTYGQAIYWQQFKDVFSLLRSIKPAKVVFLYIESYNHVVLNLACRQAGISTYQLEHGLRADYVLGFDPAISPKLPDTFSKKATYYLNLLLHSPSKIKNRLFLLKSISLLNKEDALFVREFIRVRKQHNFLQTTRQIPADKRTAEFYISFSRNIYKIHQEEDALPPSKSVYYIGIPYFDHLAKVEASEPVKAILFIDQPLAEQNLLGWTRLYKTTFAEQFANICYKLGYSLLVKPHPQQDISIWRRLEAKYNITIISNDEISLFAPQLRLVVGFYSTYLLPFAALKHTTLITYENHPSGKLMVSRAFTDAGVGHAIVDLNELYELLPNLETLHQKQISNKAKFTEDWLYKFDGKSGERLKEVLIKPN